MTTTLSLGRKVDHTARLTFKNIRGLLSRFSQALKIAKAEERDLSPNISPDEREMSKASLMIITSSLKRF